MYDCFYLVSKYKSGIYRGTPSIISKNCTGVGIYLTGINDKGRRYKNFLDLHSQNGSTHPSSMLNIWYSKFLQDIDIRNSLTIASHHHDSTYSIVLLLHHHVGQRIIIPRSIRHIYYTVTHLRNQWQLCTSASAPKTTVGLTKGINCVVMKL